MIAIADEGRAIAGVGSLDGPSQTLPALYTIPAADVHDITSGSNGYSPTYVAGAGYDLVSGIGSPVGNLLIPQLVAQPGGPSVTGAATALPSPVQATTTNLLVLGADSWGESTLTYTWTATTWPPWAAAPTFSANNGTNAGKNTTATFSALGPYGFTVTITDPSALTATSSVGVVVNQALTSITVSPGPVVNLYAAATQQFAATAFDQFGVPLDSQPAVAWAVVGGGTIDSSGQLTPPYTAGSATVLATSGAVSGALQTTFFG
jgi:hypothetical protein